MTIRVLDSAIWIRKEPGDKEALFPLTGGCFRGTYDGDPLEITIRPDLMPGGITEQEIWFFARALAADPDWFREEWERQVGTIQIA